MILSEDEARTAKRCQENFGPYFCLGSECMAWRWYDGEPAPDETETSCRGYCGKAGRPSP